MNQELLKKKHWTLEDIEDRTKSLIKEIGRLFPYYAVKDEAMEKIPIFLLRKGRCSAKAYFYPDDGSVKVLSGSTIDKNENMDVKYPEVAAQRANLFDKGVIKVTKKGIEFSKDYRFKSSRGTALSTTASFIMHGSHNGKDYWKTEDGNPIYMLINKE